ncbi:VacB/RNase II family 3'-5' exoribonuclease [Desulfobacterota bacterium AH_259_B03_O07]|nr:VacB/RNase II family 3'-5' exoribonuclease [Desulfobacterota bacterium AH_259_B03_O07]
MILPNPQEIEEFMRRPNYRPSRAREISRRLGIPKEGRRNFKKILRKMVHEGKVLRIKGDRYLMSDRVENVDIKDLPGYLTKTQTGGRVIGKFKRTGKTGMLIPRNLKVPHLYVEIGDEKRIRGDSLVVAEILSNKRQSRKLAVRVVDVLGKAGRLDAEFKGLLAEYGLTKGFPKEAIRESNQISSKLIAKDLARRKDLRDIFIFTIDNDDAKDFDDAVGITRIDSGYKLWISIADVSHYVKLGSSIDNDALQRGTSIYLPDKVIPLLPGRLSNEICSLNPNSDRLTKTVEIDFNHHGVMSGYRIYNSVIKSRYRLTYTLASELLNKNPNRRSRRKELIEKLHVMKELYEKIRERRVESGELSFDIPEPELIRDELGRTVDVIRLQRNIAHGIIEEFMIAANNAVAKFMFDSNISTIYRIHERPDISSFKDLAKDIRQLGYSLETKGQIKPKDIQRLIFESQNKPEKIAVNTLILRSLKRAIYSTKRKGHFGLALKHYTHFTSPIRRYPDLVVHRVIDSMINEGIMHYNDEALEWISNHSSIKERCADEVEREAIKLESVNMMKSHVGGKFGGIIISVLSFGIFVELKDIFVEGFIPKEKIKNRYKSNFKIGHSIRVQIEDADVERRRITLDLIS